MPARDALRVVRSDVGPRTAQDKQCAEQAVKEPVGNVLGAGPARMRVPSERDHEAPSVSSGAAGWHMPLLGPHRERQSGEKRCSICIGHEAPRQRPQLLGVLVVEAQACGAAHWQRAAEREQEAQRRLTGAGLGHDLGSLLLGLEKGLNTLALLRRLWQAASRVSQSWGGAPLTRCAPWRRRGAAVSGGAGAHEAVEMLGV